MWSVYLKSASALFCMFGGGSDANNIEGSGGHRSRLGGGRVEPGNGEIPLCGGLQVLQPRLPPGAVVGPWKLGIRTGAVSGVWKSSIRRGFWDGGRGHERGCKRRSCGCCRRRSARHRERCRQRHLQYAFGALVCEGWEALQQSSKRRADERRVIRRWRFGGLRCAFPSYMLAVGSRGFVTD